MKYAELVTYRTTFKFKTVEEDIQKHIFTAAAQGSNLSRSHKSFIAIHLDMTGYAAIIKKILK